MLSKNSEPDFLIIIIVSIGIILLFITTIITLIFLTHKRYQRHQFDVQILRQTYEQEKLKAEIEVQEQTFNFLSEEIHDNIGQSLSMVKLNLNMGSPAQIQQAKEILTTSIQNLRQMAQSLNSENLKNRDFISLIKNEVSRLQQTQAYQVNFKIETDDDEPVIDNQMLIVRIFQESLNNIIKHAVATHIDIELKFINDQISLIIEDDGVGFDMEKPHQGIGLINMKKRVKLMGGLLQIDSWPGKGTVFTLKVNLQKSLFTENVGYNDSFSR